MIPKSVSHVKISNIFILTYFLLISIYAFANHRASAEDYLFMGIFHLIVIASVWLGLMAGLVLSLLGVLIYGGWFFIQSFVLDIRSDIGLTEALRIMAIPGGAVIGGYLGDTNNFVMNFFKKYSRETESLLTTGQLGMIGDEVQFKHGLQEECSRSRRSLSNFCLVLLEINNLGELQKVLGIDAADQIAQKLGDMLCRNTRDIDKKAKLGDTLHGAIFPDTTREGAFISIDRIRQHLKETTVDYRGRMIHTKIDIVAGLAFYPEAGADPEKLMASAKEDLKNASEYSSKEGQAGYSETMTKTKHKAQKRKVSPNGASAHSNITPKKAQKHKVKVKKVSK